MEYNPANIALARRAAGRVQHGDARALRLLGDRVRLQGRSRPERGGGRAEAHRRAQHRAAARVRAPTRTRLPAIDPDATQLDLGTEPLDFAARRFALARELWERWQTRPLKDGESYAALRRNFDARPRPGEAARALIAAKYIGGVSVLRDHAGIARAPLTPVPADKQRAALELLATGVFSTDSFRFKPEFLRRLGRRLPRPRRTTASTRASRPAARLRLLAADAGAGAAARACWAA